MAALGGQRPLSRGLAHAGGLITGSKAGTRLLKDWEYAADCQQRQQRLQYRKLARSRSGAALESVNDGGTNQDFIMTRGPLAAQLSDTSIGPPLPPARLTPPDTGFEELERRCVELFNEYDTSRIGVITIEALESSFHRLHSRPPALRMTRELFERYLKEIFPSEASAEEKLENTKARALEALQLSLLGDDVEAERKLEAAKAKGLEALKLSLLADDVEAERKLETVKAKGLEALKAALVGDDEIDEERLAAVKAKGLEALKVALAGDEDIDEAKKSAIAALLDEDEENEEEAAPSGVGQGVTLEKFVEFHRRVWENQPLAVRCPRTGVSELFNSELLVRKAFSKYDKDMSGKVRKEELPFVMQDLGLHLDKAHRDRIDKFYENEFDRTGKSDRLSFHDFVRFNNQYVNRLEAAQGSELAMSRPQQKGLTRSTKLSASTPSLR